VKAWKSLASGFAATALVIAVPALSPASGQDAVSSLRGHDSNAPVDWSAERIEVQERADRVVLSGNVVATQGELRLQAPRITVAYTDTSGIQVERIDASGGVQLNSPSESARSEYAIYDLDRKLITMIGAVTLVRGGSNIRGGRLVLDLNSGRAVMDGGAPGAATAPGVQTDPSGRVHGRFTVPQRRD
jgi:lipopolysaccharide export system protein LptA